MEAAVQHYLNLSLAPSTKATYNQGTKHYHSFCCISGISSPYPLSEQLLCSFASYLGNLHLSPQTIRTYLAAIKFTHISLGYQDPYTQLPSATLKLVQRGIAREYSMSDSSSFTRLPITPHILRGIKALWSQSSFQHDVIMLWAALCTGFFGFFRLGEITSPSPCNFDPGVHLTFEDISVDNLENTRFITLRIKRSKTDQLRVGTTVSLARADGDLCPVAALLAYIAIRGDRPGPLFVFEDERYLTQALLTQHLRQAISRIGLDPRSYAGHSLRIGAATTAASKGIDDSTIKALGRWRSSAYQRYVRRSDSDLAETASSLASPPQE